MTRSLVLAAVVWLVACSGGSEPRAAEESAGGERAAPPIPLDPFALVPAEPEELVVVDLTAWRGSPHFATLRGWGQRLACMPLGPELPVIERTERVVLAIYARPAPSSGADVLVIGQGRYEPSDAADVLGELAEIVGPGPEPLDVVAHGRFALVGDGARSAAVLAPHRIVVGDAAAVERALAMADGQGEPGVREGAVFRGLDAAQWLPERQLAVLSAGDGRTGLRLGRGLRGVDRALADALDRRPRALSVALDDGVALSWIASAGDEAAARTQVVEVQSALGRADLVLRLAGLPPIAARLSAEVDGPLARYELRLGDPEVATLVAALDRMLSALVPPSCAARGSGA